MARCTGASPGRRARCGDRRGEEKEIQAFARKKPAEAEDDKRLFGQLEFRTPRGARTKAML